MKKMIVCGHRINEGFLNSKNDLSHAHLGGPRNRQFQAKMLKQKIIRKYAMKRRQNLMQSWDHKMQFSDAI